MSSRNIGLTLFLILAFALAWLSLWLIGVYLTESYQLAALFLPLGLRLALMILLPKRFWPVLVIVESVILFWLYLERLQPNLFILPSSLLSVVTALAVQRFWRAYSHYWQRLILLVGAVTLNSLLHALLIPLLTQPPTLIILTSFTSGIILVPFIYLIYEYLKQQNLQTFLDQESFSQPLRTSLLVWGSIFFAIGVCIQITINPEMESLLLVFILLPNVFMAYKFGWQGGVLSAFLGSILLTITRHAVGTFDEVRELEMFLSTQALLGIGLGVAVSRQQQLVQSLGRYRRQLEKELEARLKLAEKLIHTEEIIRKDIARELHDEIGQNITAIQIQAMLVNRTSDNDNARQAANEITRLSDRIHQSTRQLLRQLRPPILDEMSLRRALSHLIREFQFKEQGIECEFNYLLQKSVKDETLRFTLYRLLQELLNNINKHAKATKIEVNLSDTDDYITLSVTDDGVGIPQKLKSGFGLRGIGERVKALSGNWNIHQDQGTTIIVNLPTKLNKKIH